MAFDSFSLYCMVPELRDGLRGRTLRNAAFTSPYEVVLRFRRHDNEERDACLLLSAHPLHARAHRVGRFPRTKERAHFTDALVTHLARCELLDVEQVGLDRVLILRFGPPSGVLGEDQGERLLIAEMMGKHSNLILVHAETNRILEAIKHVDESRNRYREILPGASYVPPPPGNGADPFALTEEAFASIVTPSRAKATWKQLVEGIDGLNPALAKEIVARADDPESVESLWASFSDRIGRLRERRVEPCVLYAGPGTDAKALAYALFPPITQSFGHLVRYSRVEDAVAAYHERALLWERLQAMRHRIEQALDRREETVLRRRAGLRHDQANADAADTYRLYGELLMASLHRIPPRAEVIAVPNYYDADAPEVEIPLDPAKTPVENAQTYFKRYQKGKRARRRIAERLSDAEQELEWIGEFRGKLTDATDLSALERLEAELTQIGWIKEKSRRRKESERTPYRVFTFGEWHILVGRNDRENETLVTRIGKKDDLWLHAKQIAGSHVLIRNPEKKTQIPMTVLLSGAKVAAHFSKARNSSHVPVDYTQLRYVVRPKGSATGFVTYSREKTLYVEPEPPSRLFGKGPE